MNLVMADVIPQDKRGLSFTRFAAQDDVCFHHCDRHFVFTDVFFSQYYLVRNNSCCPTFLVATVGAWLAVLGGVSTDKWIVQRLTDFVRTGLGMPFAEARCRQIARFKLIP